MQTAAGEARTRQAQPTQWAAMAGVVATVTVFALAQGLSYPLLSFILERQGTAAGMIGVSAAMTPLGFVLSAPLIPVLARRYGAGRTVLVCSGLAAMLLALIGWTQDLVAWFPLRFLLGAVINPLYVLSEVWVIRLASPERRGRIMGLYTSIISAGFAAGPFSMTIVGSRGWPPFLVGIGAFLLCAVCLACVLRRLPRADVDDKDASLRDFAPKAHALLLAVLIAAATEQAILSLLPVYGFEHGMGEREAAAFLVALMAGNIVLQLPLGFAAERFGAQRMILGCAIGAVLACAVLPFVILTPLQWPLAVMLGALSYGIYTMAIVDLGARFSGQMLVAGNAAFAMMWGVGGMIGPPVSGAAMDLLGRQGLPLTIGVLCAGLALSMPWRRHGGVR